MDKLEASLKDQFVKLVSIPQTNNYCSYYIILSVLYRMVKMKFALFSYFQSLTFNYKYNFQTITSLSLSCIERGFQNIHNFKLTMLLNKITDIKQQ